MTVSRIGTGVKSSARAQLQSELSSQYGRTIHVEIFGDLFDITDEKWEKCVSKEDLEGLSTVW